MKKTIVLVLALALGLASVSPAAEDTWTIGSPMPIATSLHSASVVDGKIYVIGGTNDLYGWADYWSTVFVYDPATDTWTKKADMPTGRARLTTSVVDGKIYAIGGSPHRDAEVSTVEVYDPVTDTWTMGTDMPRARNWHSSNAVNGKIYVIGGKIYPSETMVSTVEEYDPATDTWTEKTDMPTARGMHSTSVVDGKIYVTGGVTGNLGPWVSTVEVYNPATDTWTKKADMPTARTIHSSAALNRKVYVIGGANNWGYCLSIVEVYDPATNTWAKGLDMPTARGCFSTSVVNGKIYGIGGTLNPSSWMPISTVEVYDIGLRAPSPDFNGDGIVDAADMCMMIDYWGTDEPLYDIAPPPFGDGIVDVQDLIMLAEHLFEEIFSPELIAYWKLDEQEGDIANNSIGDNHGVVYGDAIWQPDVGVKAGALSLDGVDDNITTDYVLDPSLGAFSVLIWAKGGAFGQVIISQADGIGSGNTWLGLDAQDGYLMTGLVTPPVGRNVTKPLLSESVITDNQWHHIGFIWDGTYRSLYIDGVEVAKDTKILTQPLMSSDGGLYIGADKNLEAGTFFSGLIDDIRIYNIALSAEEIAALAE